MKPYLLLLIFSLFSYTLSGQSNDLLSFIEKANNCEGAFYECLDLYEQSLQLIEKEQSFKLKGQVLYKMGRLHFIQGNQDQALDYFHKSLDYAKRFNDSTTLGVAYNGLGSLSFMKGQLETAMEYYLTAANIQELQNDEVSLSHSLINVSAALYNMKDYEESLKYLFKAYAILIKDEANAFIGTVKGNIGLHYYQLRQYDSSEYWSRSAIEVAIHKDDPEAYVLGHYITASVLLEQDKIDEAYEFMVKAVEKARAFNYQHYLGETLGVYARILSRQKKHREAISAIEEMKEIQKAFNNYLGIAQAFRIGGEVYALSQDYKSSAEHYAHYIDLYDSLLKDDASQKVIELNKKYQAAQKEQQLLYQELRISKINFWLVTVIIGLVAMGLFFILYRRNLTLKFLREQAAHKEKQLSAWLKGEQAERIRLAKELHDGVASLVGAAKMNLESAQYMKPEASAQQINLVKSILDETHQEVRMVAYDLMPASLQSKELWEAIEEYIQYFNGPHIKELKIEIAPQLKSISWDPLKKVALYRIMQESVQNIHKHAQADRICFSAEIIQEKVTIILEDNGIGFTQGGSEGLGMKNIQERILFLNGTLDIESIPAEKTILTIQIPLESLQEL